jgi:hypothetical protein
MLGVIMQGVIMLGVIMLGVIMLGVIETFVKLLFSNFQRTYPQILDLGENITELKHSSLLVSNN